MEESCVIKKKRERYTHSMLCLDFPQTTDITAMLELPLEPMGFLQNKKPGFWSLGIIIPLSYDNSALMTALFEVPRTTAGETVAKQKHQFMLSSSVHVQSGFICLNFFEGQFCSVGENSTNIFFSMSLYP